MVFHGHVEKGAVVLDNQTPLPEGAKVEVRVLSASATSRPSPARPWLRYSGVIDDLPADASEDIDQVLYGRPPE